MVYATQLLDARPAAWQQPAATQRRAGAAPHVWRQWRRPRRDRPEATSRSSAWLMATATAAGAAAAWRFPPTVTPDGQWRIAPLNRTSEDEVRAVVALQTEAFAKATGIQLLDGIERNVFRAEVLSQMRNKLRYGAEDRFVLLVAKARTGSSVLGVVEVSLVDDREVLTLLRRADGDGAPEAVPYLASMATSPRVRRQGLARHLLCAAEAIATQWEMQLVLHVYKDNQPAVGLYKASGFEVVDQDGGLLPALRLSRARYLMRKRL